MKLAIYIVLSILLNGFGQVFLKKGMTGFSSLHLAKVSTLGYFVQIFTTPFVALGLIFYGISMFIWLQILGITELSYAYPIVIGSTFAVVGLCSLYFLHENLSISRIGGILLIILGVFLVSQS